MRRFLPRLAVVLLGLWAATAARAEPIEIVRDKWGVAHVFAPNEEALFYGAGYAMAEDRLLQMLLVRHEAEGRLAEILGPGEKNRHIESDKTFRLMGLDRNSKRLVEHLLPETRTHLAAFAAGINAYAKRYPERLKQIVDLFPAPPRPWEPADCITVWTRNASQFTSGWENEIKARRQYEEWVKTRLPGEKFPGAALVRDDAAAVISEDEFRRTNPQVYERLKKLAETPAPTVGWLDSPAEEFKASHAWTVSGARSTTGKPILESNPQIPVSFPTSMYEIHLAGGRYDVRGVTFPGTPGIFIGWNRHCAWGATALGGDHADLFEERVDPRDPARYLYKGESLPFATRTETISVKGGQPVVLEVRETVHGPVVNPLLKGLREGEVYALKHISFATNYSSLEAQLKMMRAADWGSFREGMREYVAPARNLVFADDSGNIAYQALVQTPKRRAYEPLPRAGWTGKDEWELVPFDEMPSMLNPQSQTIFSANHLPIGSWYPYLVTTSRGEGPRSWRLRELLAGDRKFSPDDFHRLIHLDAVNPGVRDFVALAVGVVRESGTIDLPMQEALNVLERWNGRLVTDSPAYPVARGVLDVLLAETTENSTFARFGGSWAQYDASWSGLNGLLKNLSAQYRDTGRTPSDPAVRKWLRESLTQAVQAAWENRRQPTAATHRMPYQNNMGQWGSVAPQHDLVSPPLPCPVTQTIWSQAGETFVQIVDLANIDRSMALLPPGVSEVPGSPHAQDQVSLWVAGRMRPAPLSREAVLAVRESVLPLEWPPK